MIRNPEELTIAIKSAVNRRAVILSHLLLVATIFTHTLIWPGVEPYERILALVVCAFIVAMVFFRFFDLAKINNHPLIYIGLYQLFTFIGISFLSEPVTPYILAVFILALLSNLYYGAKGVYLTVAMFGAATLTKFFFWSAMYGLQTTQVIDIFVSFFVFAAVSSFFVHLQSVYNWDRERLKSTIKEAVIEQKRLRTLINSMTESVLVLDNNGVIKLYNAAALALFNTNTSLEGKTLAECATLTDEKGMPQYISHLLPTDNVPVARDDLILRYSKDDTAALSVTVTPLRTSFGEGGDYTGYILTMRDITREKSLEEERNEFISVISHELRTPVTVTEASLSNAMLINKKKGDDQEIGKMLSTAHEQSLYLANMLNDLATFARAEKGTLELGLEEINPNKLIELLCNDYKAEAEAKGLQLGSKQSAELSESILSNRLYIREILQNFITNAIKYSDSGTITLSVEPLDNRKIRFDVTDQGIGISTSDQKKVYDKFFRSEDFRTRTASGTGLGLYIVQKLAKLLNGKLGLVSEVGKGSTFSLIVPDLRGTAAAAQYQTSKQANEETNLSAGSAEQIQDTNRAPRPDSDHHINQEIKN